MPVVNASPVDRFLDTRTGGDYDAAQQGEHATGSVDPTYIEVLEPADFEVIFPAPAPLTVLDAPVVRFVLWRY